MVSLETAQQFHTTFLVAQEEILSLLKDPPVSENDGRVQIKLKEIKKEYEMIREVLPNYDKRKYDLQISQFESRLKEVGDRPIRSKFTFKPKITTDSHSSTILTTQDDSSLKTSDSIPDSNSIVLALSPLVNSSTSESNLLHILPSNLPEISDRPVISNSSQIPLAATGGPPDTSRLCVHGSKLNQIGTSISLTDNTGSDISKGYLTLSELSTKGGAISLSDLQNTIIDLRPHLQDKPQSEHSILRLEDDTNLDDIATSERLMEDWTMEEKLYPTALHLKNLRKCVILAEVRGSVLLSDLVDCLVISKAHQIRIYSSSQTSFYLHTPSVPIMEESNSLIFGPCPFFLPSPSSLLNSNHKEQSFSGERTHLHQQNTTHAEINKYDQIRDFDFPHGDSPNWRLATEEHVVKLQTLFYEIDGDSFRGYLEKLLSVGNPHDAFT
ncbi:hypothetical protein M231_00933 [Tremella mesenterica]|uniref:C-CAP/cofactor C-like domain-containing protein n=1 Tax=Tremella mesenterica TaxID=5217 RepID=A0A4Q1BUJ7_TREME|nr:hypothetical protein M231_00933 [Tremella mesenterica]